MSEYRQKWAIAAFVSLIVASTQWFPSTVNAQERDDGVSADRLLIAVFHVDDDLDKAFQVAIESLWTTCEVHP
jgi:hypothetical protein